VAAKRLQFRLCHHHQPSGCLHDLYPWVDITIGVGSNGDAQPSPFTNITTGDGSISMIYYNMQAGDVPYFKSLANSYTISDNFHQSVMVAPAQPHHVCYADMLWYSNEAALPKHHPPVKSRTRIRIRHQQLVRPGRLLRRQLQQLLGYDPAGVAPVVNYLESLDPPINPNCQSGHYYLLNNYNPGYDGTSGLQSGTYVIPPVNNAPHRGM
jgi:phospholipase C